MVAEHRGELDRAEALLRQALAIEVQLGDRPKLGATYAQLGLLANASERPAIALENLVRAAALFGQFPHPATAPGPQLLARLTRQLGIGALEEAWAKIADGPLPSAVREYVDRAPADEQEP